jgi:CheY-like chemotaxis protein
VDRIVAVVPDLFFATKIEAVARAAGAELSIMPPGQALARCLADPPGLVLLDLHAPGDPLALVRALRADDRTRAVRIVGFYSHVEDEFRRGALDAGIDEALPRSAFVGRLPGLLAGGSVTPAPSRPS